MYPTEHASAMVHDCQLWKPVCQGREVMTPCISPLWTKTGVLQKLLANGLYISDVMMFDVMMFMIYDVMAL